MVSHLARAPETRNDRQVPGTGQCEAERASQDTRAVMKPAGPVQMAAAKICA